MVLRIVLAIHYGMGKHIIVAGITDGPRAAEALYVFEILFPASNTFSKLSTLLLYQRVFVNTHSFYAFIGIKPKLGAIIAKTMKFCK